LASFLWFIANVTDYGAEDMLRRTVFVELFINMLDESARDKDSPCAKMPRLFLKGSSTVTKGGNQ